MATDDPNMKVCPYICPTNSKDDGPPVYLEAGSSRGEENPYAQPYRPGQVEPRKAPYYPPGAPPTYLPQPTDSTSGDILGMCAVGPWAPGHVDWTPQAGMTGVRPVVDKYSITRYSTGDWRRNNEYILTPRATDKGRDLELNTEQHIKDVNNALDNKQKESNRQLDRRVKTLSDWKKKVERAVTAITNEIDALDENRAKLKGACKILMMPEAISRECLELRTNRYEPDLVRDDAEQELIKEVAIVGEIRRVFQDKVLQVEEMMANLKAAKSSIEFDWSDKMCALKMDKQNLAMTDQSNLILYHPGVARWPENGTTLEYWEHYCAESIRNCDEVREKSAALRRDLMTAITKGSEDMKIQADRTNESLAESVADTEACCNKLEETLKTNLQQIVNIENLIDKLQDELRKALTRQKLVMTRLHARNYDRPNVENCRDEAQYALMGESKFVKESTDGFRDRIRQAETIRSELMTYRGQLEKEIACKRKSLNINQDRCARLRAFMPTPEEFANA